MTIRKVVNGELRGYIQHNGRWCYVYIMGSYDQTTLIGEPVRMLYFKLTKSSKDILSAEKSKFQKKRPATRSQKRSAEA
jgi:hypothetical protein